MPKRESVAARVHPLDSLGHGEDAIVTDIGWLFLIAHRSLVEFLVVTRTVSVRIEKVDNDKVLSGSPDRSSLTLALAFLTTHTPSLHTVY